MAKRLRNIFDQYSQQENHLTNSLLLVLNHNRNLLQAVLKSIDIKLTGKHINLLSQVAPKTIDNRSSIPDGYIYTEDYSFCIGIETKIQYDSLNREQIIGHLKQLSQYDRSYLLVLTPDGDQPTIITQLQKKHKNLIFISWIHLLKLTTKIGPDKGKNEVGKFIFDEFISYIERCYHMTPFTGFKFRDGYDRNLAQHYVKRVSEILTPKMLELYPDCINRRPQIRGIWEAWSSSKEVWNSVHPSFTVENERIRCMIILSNGCNKEWRRFRKTLMSPKDLNKLKRHLRKVYNKKPDESQALISFRQRHFVHRSKSVEDAAVEINIATLLGIDKSKPNEIWWDLIQKVAASKKDRYNYQLEIGYHLNYEKVEDLKGSKAPQLMLRCYRTLKPVYDILVGG